MTTYCTSCNWHIDAGGFDSCPNCGNKVHVQYSLGESCTTVTTQPEDTVAYATGFCHDEPTFAKTVAAPAGPKTRPMTRTEILEQARQYIAKDRNSSYGEPEDSFGCIAALWRTYLEQKYGVGAAPQINAIDVALMLDLMKTARLIANPYHEDSWIDKAGYSGCGGEIAGRTR